MDPAGRVVLHDHSSPQLDPAVEGSLLGAHVSDLVAGSALAGPSLAAVLDAIADGRELSGVPLSIRTRHAGVADAIVSVQPARGADTALTALVILQIPPAAEDQLLDSAVMRHALLDDSFRRIGATLDLDQLARGLIDIIVPRFCNSASLLVLESLLSADEPHPVTGASPLRRLATASDIHDPLWEAAFPVGEILSYPPGTPLRECLNERKPVAITIPADVAAEVARSWWRGPVARLLAEGSMLVLPLTATDSVLGLIVCVRRQGFREFDIHDAEIGMEFASRAAIFIDNARRYNRERTTALTLQRSLLPTGLSAPSSVEVDHRYLPGSQLIEVGGDWYLTRRVAPATRRAHEGHRRPRTALRHLPLRRLRRSERHV